MAKRQDDGGSTGARNCKSPSTSTHADGAASLCLDHMAFPHIVERVIHYAETDVLFAFGQTCKTYKDICHRHATQHLVLENLGWRALVLSSVRGRLLLNQHPNTHHISIQQQLLRNKCVFRTLHTLDIVGRTGPNAPRFWSPVLSNIETIRFIPRDGLLSSHSFDSYLSNAAVIFGDFPSLNPESLHTYRWAGPGLPISTRRLVWNISTFSVAIEGNANRVGHPFLETVVLHFLSFRGPIPGTVTPLVRLLDSIGYLLQQSYSATVTVVDFDLVPLCLLNFDEEPAHNPHERKLRSLEYLGGLGDRVSFHPGEDYCAQVGRARFDLETCQELW